jgi:hypothetical protein
MRDAVRAVLNTLLLRADRTITLDELGDAIGAMIIAQDEIDALMQALEAEGRVIASEPGGHGEETLKQVLDAARAIKADGHSPSVAEITKMTGLPIGRVKNALALARVIAR